MGKAPGNLLFGFIKGLILFATCPGVWAQPERLDFERIGSEQGLSHLTVTAVYQDRFGFIWFGTIDGLNRFDGYECQVYRHDPEDPASISSSFIHGILEDAEGNLWIGTRDGGLSVLTVEGRKTGSFKRYLPQQENPLSLGHDRVESFFLDRADRLWVGTQAGLALYDPASEGFIVYDFFADLGVPVLVSSMLEDENGMLWLSTSQGLFKLDLNQVKQADPKRCSHLMTRYFHDSNDPESLGAGWIYKLFLDREGYLWLGSRTSGLSRFDCETGKAIHYRHDPNDSNSLAKNYAAVHHQDAEGFLWVSTDGGGIHLMNPATGHFKKYRHQPSRSQSLSHDQVTHIFQSKDGPRGTVWVSTWGGGVNKLLPGDQPFASWRHDPEDPTSLSSSFILAVLQDSTSALWVGTAAGLNRRMDGSKGWQRFVPQRNNPKSLSHPVIWSLVEDHRGDIWIGTEAGGLNQIVADQGTNPDFVHHRVEADRATSLSEDNVKVVFEDQQNYLWVGYEARGMSRAKNDEKQPLRWRHFSHNAEDPRSINADRVRCFFQDKQGTLWVGTAHGGLARLDGFDDQGEARFTNYSVDENTRGHLNHGDIRAILEGQDGGLWIATYGGGLNRLDRDQGTFSQMTTQQGLPNNFVYGLLEDGLGHLWVSSNRGVSQLNYQTGNIVNYGTQHGLQSDEFNTGAFAGGSQGRLFFGGVLGLNHFVPSQLLARLEREKSYIPPVVLTGFTSMGEPVGLDLENLSQQPVVLAHDDQYFAFEMAALSFRNPEKNRFRYMLEGFNDQWIGHGQRRFASFTNLDPGTYRLRYQASIHPGIWHEGAELPIRIEKPFWQTWWFRALLLLAVILLGLLAWRVKQYYRAYRRLKYVAHFKILKTLGQGGAGTVYLAWDRFSKRRLALKVLHSELEDAPDGVRRFLQEAEIGSKLDHPNIVRILEAGSHGQLRYLCMEYLAGETLKNYIRAHESISEADAITMAGHILAGLQAIHEEGVVHRDLKSANLMVMDGLLIKIMDFGVARISSLTTVENRSQLMGTLAYMSPEQTLGKGVDVRADIYAFGSILHEILFRQVPFQAENEMEMIYAIHNEPPQGLAKRDSATYSPLEKIMATCLAKDPEDRYSRVAEIQKALWEIEPQPGETA